ncbi:hypothetical protein [Yinghuangia sp. YIM S09857]|uniref:hypothetical protein n=1 Tax=Yinghuangia sp. YIM S09857 TaxID=3436929 RepID=UPI003F52ECF3
MASDVVVGLELLGLSSPLLAYGAWRVRYWLGLDEEEREGLRLLRRAERGWVVLSQSLNLHWEEPTAGRSEFAWMNDPRLPHGKVPKVRVPSFSARPIRGGFVADVGTLPGVGLVEFQKVSEHLRNAWRAERVTVEQDRPGVIRVRALVTDPLTLPFRPERGKSWA